MHSSRMRTGRSLTVCHRGVCSWGVCFWGGGLLLGVCSRGVGVSALGGVVCSLGVSAPGRVCSGGCLLLGGVCSQGVLLPGVVSQHALRQTPSVDRITDTSKNITLATTSLRPVIMFLFNKFQLQIVQW